MQILTVMGMTGKRSAHISTDAIESGEAARDRYFKKRWAAAIFQHPDKPAGAVAMAFLIFMRMDSQGRGVVVTDQNFIRWCGVSDSSVRRCKSWLIKNDFIRVAVRGRRGNGTEFQATIPVLNEEPTPEYRSPLPVIQPEIPVTENGNQEECRSQKPVKRARQPVTVNANTGIPVTGNANRGIPVSVNGNSPLPIEDNNKNNNLEYTPPYSPPRRSNCVGVSVSSSFAPQEGEEHIGHGVYVNCETIRHPSFSVSLKAVEMQLATASGLGLTVEEARELARSGGIAHALQWALELENGRSVRDVVPTNPANFIRGSVAAQLTKTNTARRTKERTEESPSERRARLMAKAQEQLAREQRTRPARRV